MANYKEFIEKHIKTSWTEPIMSDFQSADFCGKDIAENIVYLHLIFRKAGLKAGDRFAIYGVNSSHWAMAFLGVNTFHGVAVPLLYDFCPKDSSELVNHSEAAVLFVQNSVWKHMSSESMPALRLVISLDDFSIIRSECGDSGSLKDAVGADYPKAFPEGITPDRFNITPGNSCDLAVINYTSGTTNAPKGVMLTNGNFDTNVMFALKVLPAGRGDRIVSMLPMAHMYGFMFEFLYPLCSGVHTYFLCKAPTPALLIQALKEIKPYLLITVPMVMEKIFKNSVRPVVTKPLMKLLLAVPGVSQLICGKIRESLLGAFGGEVREIVMGGAALSPDVERWFRKLRLPYTVGYGMTEASPLLAYEWWERFAPGSCGKAIEGCEVRIDSSDPLHVVGEIQARGSNIMMGYFKNKEATEAAFTDDGWLRTGDLGVMDADGNIFIRGRSKNMILSSNGQNIYPEELEAVINNLPDVVESIVVSREGRLVALVYTGENGPVLSKEDLALINSKLPSYSKICSIELVSRPFEKTPKQSIRRFLYK